jgi:hypothetical protein
MTVPFMEQVKIRPFYNIQTLLYVYKQALPDMFHTSPMNLSVLSAPSSKEFPGQGIELVYTNPPQLAHSFLLKVMKGAYGGFDSYYRGTLFEEEQLSTVDLLVPTSLDYLPF